MIIIINKLIITSYRSRTRQGTQIPVRSHRFCINTHTSIHSEEWNGRADYVMNIANLCDKPIIPINDYQLIVYPCGI